MHEARSSPVHHFHHLDEGLLAEARHIATVGPVSLAGRGAYLGAMAAVSGPFAGRDMAVTQALLRLVQQDRALGIHALAQQLRAVTDAAICMAVPDIADEAPRPAAPARRHDFRSRTRA